VFIPDPESDFFPSRIRIFSTPDPGSASKYFNPKNGFQALGNKIQVVHPGSGPDPDFLPIPDPGSRDQKGTGSRSPDSDPQHRLKKPAVDRNTNYPIFGLAVSGAVISCALVSGGGVVEGRVFQQAPLVRL
jgi:hypothetical protein